MVRGGAEPILGRACARPGGGSSRASLSASALEADTTRLPACIATAASEDAHLANPGDDRSRDIRKPSVDHEIRDGEHEKGDFPNAGHDPSADSKRGPSIGSTSILGNLARC